MNCPGKCSDYNAMFKLSLVPEQNRLISLMFHNLQKLGTWLYQIRVCFHFQTIRSYMSIIPTHIILRVMLMCEFDSNPIRKAFFK